MIQSKISRGLAALVASLASLALFAPASPAAETAPGYGAFNGCPTVAQSPSTPICIRSDVSGGHLQIGKKDVPIKKVLTISGGVNEELQGFVAGPEGGLSPVLQEVPGGVIGITGLDWLINFLDIEELQLFALTELAGAPSEFTLGTVTIPIKVRLINPVLGNNCYVGSNSNPIVLKLTTGTTSPPPPNEPITGKEPELGFDPELLITRFSNGTYVDNAFSAPAASGCVLKLFGFIPFSLNGFVNSQAGLPSAAGKNEAVQEFDLELAPREAVYP